MSRIAILGAQRTAIGKFLGSFSGLSPADLKTKTNAKKITFPRQIAMYFTRELTGGSYPEIGKQFGGKHHTTVMHSIQKIEQLIKTDEKFGKFINNFKDSFT